MARLTRETGEDVAFIEDALFSLGFIAEISTERGRRHDTHLAVMDRLVAAAPKEADLEHAWELATRVDDWKRRDDAMQAVIRQTWHAADVLGRIRITLDSRSAELREFDRKIERHAVNAMLEVLNVVRQYLGALNRRRDAASIAIRLNLCDAVLKANHNDLESVSDRFPDLRQSAQSALVESARVRDEVRDRLAAIGS